MEDYSKVHLVAAPRATDSSAESKQLELIRGAAGVGVKVERAVIGSGMTLARFAELLDERPEIHEGITAARLAFEVDLHASMVKAANEGKHQAAQALLADLRPVGQEIADCVMAANDGNVGAMTPAEIEEHTSRYFAESD